MSLKRYIIYCEFCGYKRITDGTDVQDLVPYKESPIPGGVPHIDPENKKLVSPKSFFRPKKFKCPKCGRLVTPRKMSEGQGGIDEKDWLA